MSAPCKVLTSVRSTFNGNHVDPDTGALHGHDYVVEASWVDTGERFEVLRARLELVLAALDHRPLPNAIWSAEDLARWLLPCLACDELAIHRPALGHSVVARL